MAMSTNRSTIGLVAALSVLLIVLAFITREVLDIGTGERPVRARITVGGMEQPGDEAGLEAEQPDIRIPQPDED